MKVYYKEFKNVLAVVINACENYYLYDAYSNYLFSVPKILAVLLDDYYTYDTDDLIERYKNQYSAEEIMECIENISRTIINNNCLKKYKIEEFTTYNSNVIDSKVKEKLDFNLNQLLFNVTESCNLNCKYCAYSGEFEEKREHNTSNDLTWDIAKRSIDFFLPRSSRTETRIISFYGGEPLLRFELIKKIIDYSMCKATNIKFALVTNGTLLSPKVVEYLIDKNVFITISLDGPIQVHDKYRINKNGKGSYVRLMENVEYIKESHPHYFNNTLKINSVIAPSSNYIEDINAFFSFNRFPSIRIFDRQSLIMVNPSEKFFKESEYEGFMNNFSFNVDQTLLDLHKKGIKSFRELPTFVRSGRELKRMHFFHYRKDTPLDELEYHWPNNICIPGHKTLFVSSKGDFYPCEQMYDKDTMKIGNLQEGFCIKKIIRYLDDYIEAISPMCSNCWAIRLCSECFITLSKNGSFNRHHRRKFCKDIKTGWMNTILNYSLILEDNPAAFNYFERISNKEYDPIEMCD